MCVVWCCAVLYFQYTLDVLCHAVLQASKEDFEILAVELWHVH